MKYNIELDYTSAINMFVALGIIRCLSNISFTDSELALMKEFLFGFKKLKWEALIDQQWDEWLKNELPKVLDMLMVRRK